MNTIRGLTVALMGVLLVVLSALPAYFDSEARVWQQGGVLAASTPFVVLLGVGGLIGLTVVCAGIGILVTEAMDARRRRAS